MKLSVVVPCFNEEDNIITVLDAIINVGIEKEIIVVDDGSTDSTARIVIDYSKNHDIVVHISPKNCGKGSAIRTGLEYVTGDVVVIQDADLEYDPQELYSVVEPIIKGEADVVYGSRFLGSIQGMKVQNRVANRILTLTANLLYSAHITDEATCYKAFRSDILKSIQLSCTRFEFCPEVTAKIRKRNLIIKEVPVTYKGRNTAQGKKIRWTDAFSAMWTLIKYRFTG